MSLALGRPAVEALLDHSPLDVYQMVELKAQVSVSVSQISVHRDIQGAVFLPH